MFCFGRETFRFMYDRPWKHVLDFYSDAVEGNLSVLNLFQPRVSIFYYQHFIIQLCQDGFLLYF